MPKLFFFFFFAPSRLCVKITNVSHQGAKF